MISETWDYNLYWYQKLGIRIYANVIMWYRFCQKFFFICLKELLFFLFKTWAKTCCLGLAVLGLSSLIIWNIGNIFIIWNISNIFIIWNISNIFIIWNIGNILIIWAKSKRPKMFRIYSNFICKINPQTFYKN